MREFNESMINDMLEEYKINWPQNEDEDLALRYYIAALQGWVIPNFNLLSLEQKTYLENNFGKLNEAGPYPH